MTLNDRLAEFFKARPHQWVHARHLLPIAGFAAWRTRLSELRRAPYSMPIENRTERRAGQVDSFYRYVPR